MMLVPTECVIPDARRLSGCTPPADQYLGLLMDDGTCFPLRKSSANLHFRDECTPDLRGRGTLRPALLPETLECVIEARRERPHSPSFEELQQSIEELKDEIEKLKSNRP
jgi:hypothetical protein